MDLHEYLSQDVIWYPADGGEIKIKDMTPNHAAMCAEWLSRNATGLIGVVEASKNEDAALGEGDVRDVLALVAVSPKQWMQSTGLYRALKRQESRS
jgi:hypothetical protein